MDIRRYNLQVALETRREIRNQHTAKHRIDGRIARTREKRFWQKEIEQWDALVNHTDWNFSQVI